MSQQNKVKLTQKEFDEFYEIEGIKDIIKEETKDDSVPKEVPPKDESILTSEQQEYDDKLESELNWDDEE